MSENLQSDQAPDVAVQQQETTNAIDHTFLLAGMPLYQKLLAGPGWLVFLKFAVPGVLLSLLSIPMGIATIPTTYDTGFTKNLGLLYRANWTWAYIVVWPAALITFRLLSEHLRNSVNELTEMKILVPNEKGGPEFLSIMEARLRKSGRPILLWTIVGTLIFTLADTLDLSLGYWSYASGSASCAYVFAELDWSVAFAAECWTGVSADSLIEPPGIIANGIFVVLAYLMQSLMIVSFVVFFLRLAQFFFVFAASLKGSDYKLDPWLDDPMKRLGLAPLGRSYNLFLTLILIFEVFVAGHRMQQIALQNGVSLITYAQNLIVASAQPARWLDPEIHAFDTADIGTITLVVAVVIPLTVVCWFPLFQLRAYIQNRKMELTREWAKKRAAADLQGNKEMVTRYEKQGQQLEAANVWPNGDATAQRFILAMALLWLASMLPVVSVSVALGAFGVLELIRIISWFIDRHKQKKAPETGA